MVSQEGLAPAGESPLFTMQSAIVREFTPGKLAIATNQGFSPLPPSQSFNNDASTSLSCPHFTEEETEAHPKMGSDLLSHSHFLHFIH